MHLAADVLTAEETAFINSVVLFGDPDDGETVGSVASGLVSVDCHIFDDICLHGIIVDIQHLDYCFDAGVEAAFAVAQSGLLDS